MERPEQKPTREVLDRVKDYARNSGAGEINDEQALELYTGWIGGQLQSEKQTKLVRRLTGGEPDDPQTGGPVRRWYHNTIVAPAQRFAEATADPERYGPMASIAGQIAGMAVPPTPEAAAIDVATLGRGRLGRLASTFPRRLGVNVGVGAGVSAATGGDPLSGVAQGITATGAEQAGRAIGWGARRGMQWETEGRRIAQSNADSFRFLKEGIGAELGPDVSRAIPVGLKPEGAAQEILKLRDPDGLQKLLSTMFQGMEDMVSASAGNSRFQLDRLGAARFLLGMKDADSKIRRMYDHLVNVQHLTPDSAEKYITAGLGRVTGKQALQSIRFVAGQRRAVGNHEVAAIREEFADALRGNGFRREADRFTYVVGKYRQGILVRDLLEEVGGLGALSRGNALHAGISADDIRQFLTKNAEQYPPSALPMLWLSLHPKGAQLGSRDVVTKLGGERVFLGGPGALPGTSIGLPKGSAREAVGSSRGRRIPSRILGGFGGHAGGYGIEAMEGVPLE